MFAGNQELMWLVGTFEKYALIEIQFKGKIILLIVIKMSQMLMY